MRVLRVKGSTLCYTHQIMTDMELKSKFKILKGAKGFTLCETQLSAEDHSLFKDFNEICPTGLFVAFSHFCKSTGLISPSCEPIKTFVLENGTHDSKK